jgi:hypothetical protein
LSSFNWSIDFNSWIICCRRNSFSIFKITISYLIFADNFLLIFPRINNYNDIVPVAPVSKPVRIYSEWVKQQLEQSDYWIFTKLVSLWYSVHGGRIKSFPQHLVINIKIETNKEIEGIISSFIVILIS